MKTLVIGSSKIAMDNLNTDGYRISEFEGFAIITLTMIFLCVFLIFIINEMKGGRK